MADQAAAALIRLGSDFEMQRCHEQAAKCLSAACGARGALPATQAAAALAYAEVLLAHFDNLDAARHALLAAELALRPARGDAVAKCRVHDALARVARLGGDARGEGDALAAGLAAAAAGGAPRAERAELKRWSVYFLFRRAEAAFAAGGPAAARAALEAVDAGGPPAEAGDRALLALSRAVLELHDGDVNAAETALGEAAVALDELGQGRAGAGAGGDAALPATEVQGGEEEEGGGGAAAEARRGGAEVASAETANRRARGLSTIYALAYTLNSMESGRAAQLVDGVGEDSVVFGVLEAAGLDLNAAAADGGESPFLPRAPAAALAHVLQAALLRGVARRGEANSQLALAEEAAARAAARLGVDWARGEAELPAAAAVASRAVVGLRAVAVAQRAVCALVGTDLASAAAHGGELLGALRRFPRLLAGHAPHARLLCGHYAAAAGEHAAAAAHFDAVAAAPAAAHLGNAAALGGALAELHRPGGSAAAAVARLEARGMARSGALQALPAHDRAAAALIHGLLLQRAGDAAGARLLLTKALKHAHSLVGSHQLVAQVLNALAPVQRARADAAGAAQMLDSALTMARGVNDLAAFATAARGLARLAAGAGDAARAKESADLAERKEVELEARRAKARKTPEHAELLAWPADLPW
jgi:hypothetical protein